MKKLTQELLRSGDRPDIAARSFISEAPERILQFGEGNFLRGFVDWMIHQLNKQRQFNGRVVTIQPTPHGKIVPKLNSQDGLYTVVLRGILNGQTVDETEIVSSVSRGINPYTDWAEVLKVAEDPAIQLVFSNTTEAGLNYVSEPYVPSKSPLSFPAKLTACLYHRYQVFNGEPGKGWAIIPCELVEDNGVILRDTVLRIANDWSLPDEFKTWVLQHNHFCNTLVDRIVTGYPKDNAESYRQELGYDDELLTVGEPFHLFVIDGDSQVRELIPFDKAGLNVHWDDVEHFRTLKVRILNGAHTLMCPVGLLAGKQTVRDVMEDPALSNFVKKGIYEEILPVLQLGIREKEAFAESVLDRFLNPFTKHFLMDISLNSISKFKARLLPTVEEFSGLRGELPSCISYSFAALIVLYKGVRFDDGNFIGKWGAEEYVIRDHAENLRLIYGAWSESDEVETVVERIINNSDLWGTRLSVIPGFQEQVVKHVSQILEHGIQV